MQFDLSGESVIELRTSQRPLKTSGGQLTRIADGLYDLTVHPVDRAEKGTHLADGYHRTEVIIDFASH
jgi:hypothetical protein